MGCPWACESSSACYSNSSGISAECVALSGSSGRRGRRGEGTSLIWVAIWLFSLLCPEQNAVTAPALHC